MMTNLPPNAALLIVDVQKAFDHPKWGARNNPYAERNMERLLAHWRATSRPVIHVQHASDKPTSVFWPQSEWYPIKDALRPLPHEPVLQKRVNSCFIGTDLEAQLREQRIETIVIMGLTTPHCVSTTARMAENLGFRPYVVADATASFDVIGPDGQLYPADLVQAVSLATLHGEFATVVTTEDLLAAPSRHV